MTRHILALACCALAITALAAGERPVDGRREMDRDYAVRLHRGLLGRAPRPAELGEALRALEAAPYRVVVHNRLLDSPEFSERVSDSAFLVGLYAQLRGRSPLLHEMLIGRHYLAEGVPRSEIFGQLLQPRRPIKTIGPGAASRYDSLALDFNDRALDGYARTAGAYALGDEAIVARLRDEAAALGGPEPGLPETLIADDGGSDPAYNVYYGYLHAHTSVSLDAQLRGSPGPFEAFDYARTVAKLDFLGLSDHAEFISTWPWDNEWDRLQAAVDAHSEDGVFVALRGFEYSNPLYGHINVFGTDDFTNTWLDFTLRQFYNWLALHPEAASTFNHPGQVDWLGIEFMHFLFFPKIEQQMVGIELLTHNATYEKYSVGYVPWDGSGHLDEAIRAGWRIASVSAQDNHRGGWGTIDDYRTGVLALSLTQENILDALRHRRFFSTQDKNLTMSFRTRRREMGSIVGPGRTVFTVDLGDDDGESFRSIDLYENGVLLESRTVSGTGPWGFRVDQRQGLSYYYVLATQEDDDQAMSAPIWVQGPARD